MIRVWDLETKSMKFSMEGHEEHIYSVDWSRDGKIIVSGSGDRSCRVWDSETGQCILVIDNDKVPLQLGLEKSQCDAGVTSLALGPLNGNCLVTGSLDHMVRVWDLRTGLLIERFAGHTDSVYSVAFSPDGRAIVSGSLDRTIKIWDLSPSTISIFSRYPQSSQRSTFAASAQSSTTTITSTSTSTSSSSPALVTRTCRHTFGGHKDFVLTVGFAGANASFGRVSEGGEPVSTTGGEALAEVEWVVSGSKDRTVIFWNARSAAGADAITELGGIGSAGDGRDVVSDIFQLQGQNSVLSVSLASVGGLFATGSGDTKARVWRVSAATGSVPAGPTAAASRP